MAKAIGASGVLGVALETTSGTYTAPTKFIPFNSESLKWTQETTWRAPIRNTPGLVGAIKGNGHAEGDIEFDVTPDVLLYFLVASRCKYVKTGSSPNFSYTFKPSPDAVPSKTMSIAIKRNEEVFGYVGCVVSSMTISIDGGALKCTVSIIGTDEQSQSALTPIWPTSEPFGAGMYKIEVPKGTQIFDSDTFEFAAEDNAEAQHRIKDSMGAQFVKFGESRATVKLDRDFENRTDYDAWKQLTKKEISFSAINGDEEVIIEAPVAIADTYEVAIGGQGDLVRASIQYNCIIDATGNHFSITLKTAEDLAA